MTPSDPASISRNSQKTAVSSAPVQAPASANLPRWRRPITKLAVLAGILLLCFSPALDDLVHFSTASEFFSYIPLIPLITGYLIWIRRDQLNAEIRPAWGATAAMVAGGVAVLAAYGWAFYRGWIPEDEDFLAIMMTSLLLLLAGAGFATLGAKMMAAMAFPVSMLVFMVPYPAGALDVIEAFFQHTSAAAASGMLLSAGTPVTRHTLTLTLWDVLPYVGHPSKGLTLLVAPECSGIHSSQVLLITSLLAGNLFLRSPWRRVVLAVFVIPLAIVRNGFRIFTIAELCVHVNGTMIDSPIHHRGGPIFFALSLIPFFIFLVWLRKSESKTGSFVKELNET